MIKKLTQIKKKKRKKLNMQKTIEKNKEKIKKYNEKLYKEFPFITGIIFSNLSFFS